MVLLDDGLLVIFGGQGKGDVGLNDLFVLDLMDTLSWRKPEVTGTPPSPRWNAIVWKRKDLLFVFGGLNFIEGRTFYHVFDLGCGDGGNLTDCFVLDTKTWVWSAVEQFGEVPPATQRYRSTLCGPKLVCIGEKGPEKKKKKKKD